MPPPESPPQSNAGRSITQSTEPYYSNEGERKRSQSKSSSLTCHIDVAILHDIVVLAEALLPTLPERERLATSALFSAYYDILPRVGINADYDSRYARVLFKIGGLRTQETLYEKFERILSRMGIDIEIIGDGEEDEDYDTTGSLEGSQDGATAQSVHNAAEQEDIPCFPERPRRNSESTKWDLGTEAQSRTPNRRNSLSATPNPNQYSNGPPRFLQELSKAQPSPTKKTQDRHQDDPVGSAGPRVSLQVRWPHRERGRSLSTHGSIRIRRHSTSAAPSHQFKHYGSVLGSEYPQGAASEATAITSFGEENDGRRSSKSYNAFAFEQSSPGLLEIKASLILQHHVTSLAKNQIAIWRERALQLREDSRGLELIALNHDRKALLRSALTDWRSRLQYRQVSAETEGFFLHLEARATRARDLYLMHIAFTHWSACATEQVQRTALARRHIIRTRVFNAWREITAVNELKVRRQVLKKFFGVWKNAQTAIETQSHAAIHRYNGNLVEKVYRAWVEKHWTIKATTWMNEGIKRRILFRWIVESHKSWEERRTAEEKRRLQLVRNTWSIWRAKTLEHIQQRETAESYYLFKLCRKPFRRWHQETLVIPAISTVRAHVQSRILREAFEIWLQHCRQEKQAEHFDRMKILQEAWTEWQFKNRTKIVRARIDARIISKSIYKWVLAARIVGMKRRVEGRIKHEIIDGWSSQSQVAITHRLDQEDKAQAMVVYERQTSVFAAWRSKMDQHKRLENTASSFYEPRVLQDRLTPWRDQVKHIQQLQRWAGDANFYFLASKTLKQWKSSTETVKREKRKNAYTQVRRMKKVNLVGGMFRDWQRRAREVLNLNRQAQEANHHKITLMVSIVLDRWHGRVEDILEMQASCHEVILRKHHDIWQARSNALRELEVEATMTFQERQQSRALKKWSLGTLKLRAQSNYALDIYEKNAKKKFRKILQYWHQKAAQKRPFIRPNPVQLGITARAGTWSDVGDDLEINDWAKGLDEPPASALVPGYLSTPSKRTERAKSIATRFSTTPRMPLSTPIERQFRAQYSGGELPSFRRPFGRSAMGLGGGFADISEKDMSNDE